MASMFLAPTLTPHGHLVLVEDSAAAATDSEVGQRLRDAFARGPGTVCYSLGWRGRHGDPRGLLLLARVQWHYVTRLCSELIWRTRRRRDQLRRRPMRSWIRWC